MENSNYQLIKEIVINNPPTKYTINYKKPKYDREGKLVTHQDYYLTSNLFFNNNTSFHVISKIITEVKRFLHTHMRGLPEIEQMRLEIIYRRTKAIDIDNVGYFWRKLFMDILKTPSSKQVLNANRNGKDIITTRTIPDDNTKHVREYSEKFEHGEHVLIFRIYGRVKDTQQELNLNFI